MVCYLCRSGASLECRSCHRWICIDHEAERSRCSACAEADTKIRLQQERETQQELAKVLWCDYCQASSTHGWSTAHQCARCARQFCRVHGQSVWIRDGRYARGWVRCVNHLEFPGVFGHKVRQPRFELLKLCLMLIVAYTGTLGVILNLFARKPDYFSETSWEETGRSHRTFVFVRYTWMGEYKSGSPVFGLDD